MLKQLRRRFITITMLIVTVILLTIFVLINVLSYVSIIRNSEMIFSHEIMKPLMQKDEKNFVGFPKDRNFSRYMMVIFDKNNIPEIVRGFETEFYTEDDIINFAETALIKRNQTGFMDEVRYKVVEGNNTVVMMLDCSIELEAFKNLLIISSFIFILSEFIFFVIALLLVNSAIRPVIESYKKQKQFITNAGHELKTPLTVISTDTELIELENGKNEWTESISNQINRLNKLTQQLIDLSKMDETEVGKEKNSFNLSNLLKDAIFAFEPIFKKEDKNIELKIQEKVYYKGNIEQIERLFSILLDNAQKYSKEASTVKIMLSEKNKKIILAIENKVENLKEGMHPELFERFYRADQSRNSQQGGSGLGLSIAQEIINHHNGKISAECDEKGIFKLTIKF